jgi:hypothetical protein
MQLKMPTPRMIRFIRARSHVVRQYRESNVRAEIRSAAMGPRAAAAGGTMGPMA